MLPQLQFQFCQFFNFALMNPWFAHSNLRIYEVLSISFANSVPHPIRSPYFHTHVTGLMLPAKLALYLLEIQDNLMVIVK